MLGNVTILFPKYVSFLSAVVMNWAIKESLLVRNDGLNLA